MAKNIIVLRGVVAVIFVTACFLFFNYSYPFYLFHSGQMPVPVPISDLSSYLDKPAVLASFIGDFLSSRFSSPTVAASVITLVFLVEWFIITKMLNKFNIGNIAILYALFPVVFEWIFYCQLSNSLSSALSIVHFIFMQK